MIGGSTTEKPVTEHGVGEMKAYKENERGRGGQGEEDNSRNIHLHGDPVTVLSHLGGKVVVVVSRGA